MAEVSVALARRENDPPTKSRPRITFVSRCPKCGRRRLQHGYTRRILLALLNRRSKIDAD